MKQTQEFDGKNVDNAVERACSALNIAKKNLVYDVISSGSTGIFGIVGVRKARIRVTLPDKRDGDKSTLQSSYDTDRAGVMSIVDEAFGKEMKPEDDPPSEVNRGTEYNKSDNQSQNSSDEATPDRFVATSEQEPEKEKESLSGNEKNSDYTTHSEERRHQENRKKRSGDRPPNVRGATDKTVDSTKARKSKPSGRKPVSGKATAFKSSTDQSVENQVLAENSGEEKPDAEKAEDEKSVARQHGRGKFSGGKPATGKSYSRKSRPRKKDTWLRADGDDALNEAMDAMDPPDGATAIQSTDKQSSRQKLQDSVNDNEIFKSDEQYTAESDDEFLNEDFHVGGEDNIDGDDDPYIKDDDEIVQVYDERDDGYPPKYKGEVPVDVSEEAMRIGRETLQKMVTLITDDTTVTAESDEDRLLLKVEGGNSGVLIGRRGQTLEAMQYLTDKIINRYSDSRVRLKVDIEGYMETRKANLKTLAYKMADKAKKTGKPATINQMTAQDRRIIHLTLKDDTRVRTQSMGDGYYRRLVIFPKKSSFKRKKPLSK